MEMTTEMLSRIILATLSGAVILTAFLTPLTYAQEVDLDRLCQRSPQNSQCEDDASSPEGMPAAEDQVDYVLRVQLDTSGQDDEWVLVVLKFSPDEAAGIDMAAYHATTFAANGLLTRVLNGALGFVRFPIPFRFSDYADTEHGTRYIAFTPDSCQTGIAQVYEQGLGASDCTISGVAPLTLPADADIRQGLITLVYTEDSLIRSVTFRLTDQEVIIENEAELANLCQQYPLNTRCRYYPLQQAQSEG